MLNSKYIRENKDLIKRKLEDRGSNFDLNSFLAKEESRKKLLAEVENLKFQKKEYSSPATLDREKAKEISNVLKGKELKLREMTEESHNLTLNIPNLCDDDVPVGSKEGDNVILRSWGEKPKFNKTPEDHHTIGERLGLLDFKRAVKISGARFALTKGLGAKLERALAAFMLDFHSKEGYEEISVPYLVKEKAMYNSGQLPKFKDDAFSTLNGMYLIPTSEVSLINMHADEVLSDEALPLSYTALTPNFRQEAGSYGKDTKGLIRLHQFNKVELVKIVRPEKSGEALKKLLDDAENILRKLGLHYRVVLKCTGDTGFHATKTYDLEVWFPGMERYVEVSSCSNTKDFQSRRAHIKYKDGQTNKNEYVHILNGTGVAIGRILAAILENYQGDDGGINIPEILSSYIKEF